MKKTIILILLLLNTMFSISCQNNQPWKGNRPCDQPGTTWESGDGLIRFSVNEKGIGKGISLQNDRSITIHTAVGPGNWLYIYDDNGKEIECWQGDFTSPESFQATVKQSACYDRNTVITVNRIKNG